MEFWLYSVITFLVYDCQPKLSLIKHRIFHKILDHSVLGWLCSKQNAVWTENQKFWCNTRKDCAYGYQAICYRGGYCFTFSGHCFFNHTHGDTEGLYAMMLTLPTPCISESCIKIKINTAFSFHASLWLFNKFSSGIGTWRVNMSLFGI